MANYDLTYEGSRVQGILDTGDELRDAGYIFRGEATPSTVPGTPTERVAYIGGPGTYTNFGSSITVGAGCICVFKYTGSAWSNQVIDTGLSDAISSEASARQLGDSTLQGGINTVSAAITAINNAIGNGSVYAGIATPSSTPASGKVFYFAFTAGTYTNFNNLEVPQGINILKNNGSTWLLDSFSIIDDAPTQGSANLVKSGGVLNSIIQNGPAFDLSAYNNGTTYADLNAALTALNALPADYKKGGMSVKFVLTSDNKYVQFFCTADEFTTDVTKWQGVDENPTLNSNNLVKSGGVAKDLFYLPNQLFLAKNKQATISSGTKSTSFVIGSSNEDRFAVVLVSGGDCSISFKRTINNVTVIMCTYALENGNKKTVMIPKNCTIAELSVPENVSSNLNLYATISVNSLTSKVAVIEGNTNQWKNGVNTHIKNINNKVGIELNLGEIGNYMSSTGAYTLSETNTMVCTMIPLKTGKGKVLDFTLPSNIRAAFNAYPNTNSGVARTDWSSPIIVDGSKLITTDEYLFLMFSHTDNSPILPYEISDIESGVHISMREQSQIDYYNKLEYGSYDKLDLSGLLLQRGSLNNNSGEVFQHSARLFSDFIPVKPASRLTLESKVVDENYIVVNALFYHMDEDGNYTWLSDCQFKVNSYNTWTTYAATQPTTINKVDVQVPTTCNAVRFYFVGKGSTTLNKSDITNTYIEIWCHTKEGFAEIMDNYIDISEATSLNLNGAEWIQGGLNYASDFSKHCMTASVIKVKAGQRLLIKHGNENKSYYVGVWGYNNINTSKNPNKTDDITATSIVYTVPSGINYIRLKAKAASTAVTPSQCVSDDWHIFDVTGNTLGLQHSSVHISAYHEGSYAQGMAIQDGYLFQAFADGTIDIYNLTTKVKIQTLVVPKSSDTQASVMHCNNITFGDKYDAADTFGILWISNEEPNTKMVGVRVTLNNNVFAFEKVYEVLPPSVDTDSYTADDQYIDFKAKQLVQVAYTKDASITSPVAGYGNLYITLYTWTGDFQDGSFTEVHSFTFPILAMVQGGRLIDNILYLTSGAQVNSITAFNVIRKEAVGVLDLTRKCFNVTDELQGFDWSENGVYVTSTKSDGNWKLYKLLL